VPDKILQIAEEVVNIDLPADELISRLKRRQKFTTTQKFSRHLPIFFSPKKYCS